MNAAEIRAAILARSKPVLREAGEVPGIGKVFVKTATVAERKELLQLGGVKADGKEAVVESPDRFTALCVTRLAVDESGVRIWSDNDVPTVMGLAVDDPYWGLVGKAAMAALGPDAKAVEETKGN
ncbi:MAG: hypothetical protein JNJ54_35025 [Myxococcaceae bacterium]|nr:hypothetical protein [Myxococcaceae bacterium]